ncbi:BnaA01g33300D [Brassica napus]|uniref:BnaA01g33300D protein n=1 Tax=Brassica napus TaxID=3708 RepID=A0A078H852_BRANA|nr:BnaA01g33300D [Brassica napus]
MKYTRSVLVIHNIAHQGRGPVDDFSYVDLPGHYLDSFKLYDPVGGEHFNIFAAGLKAADRVLTVRHGYSWEVRTVRFKPALRDEVWNRSAGKLIHALGNCLLTYREYKESWEGLLRRGMAQDLSWDNAAENYEEVLVAAKYQW